MQYRKIDETRILEAHPLLQKLLRALQADGVDFMVLCAHRGEADQNAALRGGFSKARFGQSPHNFKPSRAVDLSRFAGTSAAYAALTRESYNALAVQVKVKAAQLGIAITWGGDFRSFKDRPHFELRDWKAMGGKPG